MVFESENQIISMLKSNMLYLFAHGKIDSMAIAEELPVNHRIIDLAIACIGMENNTIFDNEEMKRIFRKLNMTELDVLSIFYQYETVSIQKLSKFLKMKPDRIMQLYLDKFINLNLITKISRYCYCTTEWARFSPMYVIAIEAKLSRWNDALQQATDNLNFADFSYVALPAYKNLKKTVIGQFKEHNVGLIGVQEQGAIKILYHPKKNRKYNEPDFRLQRLRLYRDLICKNSKWYMVESFTDGG